MEYVGSLYAPDIPSTGLRSIAMSQADSSSLPPNGFSVQALLLTAIAANCEDELNLAREILDRAICMTLDIRFNSRAFADVERDPVLAESWRRTFWGLYIIDGTFAATRHAQLHQNVYGRE